MLTLFEVTEVGVQRVGEIGAHARKRGSFGKVAAWARQYRGLESDARSLAIYDTELIHGLFQTCDYARVAQVFAVVRRCEQLRRGRDVG